METRAGIRLRLQSTMCHVTSPCGEAISPNSRCPLSCSPNTNCWGRTLSRPPSLCCNLLFPQKCELQHMSLLTRSIQMFKARLGPYSLTAEIVCVLFYQLGVSTQHGQGLPLPSCSLTLPKRQGASMNRRVPSCIQLWHFLL